MINDLYASTLKQLNSKIIPFIVICYFVANLDKTNISIAALQMNADLGLTTSMYGLGVGMFYISYILFEIPVRQSFVQGKSAELGARRVNNTKRKTIALWRMK